MTALDVIWEEMRIREPKSVEATKIGRRIVDRRLRLVRSNEMNVIDNGSSEGWSLGEKVEDIYQKDGTNTVELH